MTIREILEELCRKSHQAKGTDSYYPIVDKAVQEISEIFSRWEEQTRKEYRDAINLSVKIQMDGKEKDLRVAQDRIKELEAEVSGEE